MILAAGLGTRLMPLTAHLPKPLVPVGDAPVLAHVLRGLEGIARGKVVVNAYHLADALRAACDPARVQVVTEAALLGTAGGVRNAAPWLGDADVLVWNGDILAPALPVRDLVAVHRQAGAQATLAVRPRTAGEGNVGVDAAGRVVRLRGQRFAAEVRGGEFLGIHVIGSELRGLLPQTGCLVGDLYLPRLALGADLRAFFTEAPFSDIGSLDAYRAANRTWLEAAGRASYVHPTAIAAGRTDGSVVGAGAVVRADVVDCVVWPGAEVLEPQVGRILGPKFRA